MKRYRFVKQEGTQREVLGETVTELDVSGQGVLVLQSDHLKPEDIEAFKREFEKLMAENPMPLMVVSDDVKVEYLRLEEVGE